MERINRGVVVGVRVTPQEKEQIEKLALADQRPVSEWIRVVISRELDREKIPDKCNPV